MLIFAFPKQYEQKQLQAFEMTLTWILALYIARVYDLKAFITWLWGQLPSPSSFFTQISFNTGTGFPFQAQTSFFYTWMFCALFCCQTTEGWVINALVPALFVQHQWLNPSVLISCSHAKKGKLSQAVLIPGTQGADHSPTTMQHPAEHTQNIILSASSVMLPPGICFRGNVNHSGKGECLSGKHLGENCSMASLSWLRIALSIQFSTSETPMGTLLLLSSRASDSLEPKIESLLKTVVTQ